MGQFADVGFLVYPELDRRAPMAMAAAYATVAARGRYCSPIAITQVVTSTGLHLPVKSADCHQVVSAPWPTRPSASCRA